MPEEVRSGEAIMSDEEVMSDEDRAYYRRRAEEEVERACAAGDARSVRLHYHLASFYLERVYGGGGEAGAKGVRHGS
jgi:hypothetical protein